MIMFMFMFILILTLDFLQFRLNPDFQSTQVDITPIVDNRFLVLDTPSWKTYWVGDVIV